MYVFINYKLILAVINVIIKLHIKKKYANFFANELKFRKSYSDIFSTIGVWIAT